jgi:hypothetical protein
MADYSRFSDATIRNKTDLSEEEAALADFEVTRVADSIAGQYRNEPKFLEMVTLALAQRILKA